MFCLGGTQADGILPYSEEGLSFCYIHTFKLLARSTLIKKSYLLYLVYLVKY